MDVTRTGQGPTAQGAGLSADGARGPRKSERGTAPTAPATPKGDRADRVTLSDEALRLLDAAEVDAPDAPPASTLSPERRAELLGRIAGGWYDRPEVKAAVVHELAGHLAGDDSATDPR